jgi:hypothetical protein
VREVPPPVCQSVDEIEVLIAPRQHKVSTFPPGRARQSVLDEIAQLRIEANSRRGDNVIPIKTRRVASRETSARSGSARSSPASRGRNLRTA